MSVKFSVYCPRGYCLVQRGRAVLGLAPIPLTDLTDHFPANALWLEVPLFDVDLRGLGEPFLYLPSTFGRQGASGGSSSRHHTSRHHGNLLCPNGSEALLLDICRISRSPSPRCRQLCRVRGVAGVQQSIRPLIRGQPRRVRALKPQYRAHRRTR